MTTLRINSLIIALALWALCSCKNEETSKGIPSVYVDIQINLNNLEYQPLQQVGGFVYVEGGAKGIIVYRESANNYRAIERNCSYEPNETCARVEVDNSLLFLQCECCSSQFDFNGGVITSPATQPLRLYKTEVTGNFLYITN